MNYGDSINVKLEGAIAITAKINGRDVSVLDNHIIPLAGLNVGTYNLTVTTVPDEDHYFVTMNATITVNPIQTQLTGNSVTAIYKANKYLVITLKDANGNPISGVSVTVDLNGAKTYSTDRNGQVRVSIKALAPKKYFANFSAAIVHSSKLAEGHREAFSPSFSLGWNAAREHFMEGSIFDDLMLSASYSVLNTDLGIDNYYMYKGYYTQDGAWWGWYDGQSIQSVNVKRIPEISGITIMIVKMMIARPVLWMCTLPRTK